MNELIKIRDVSIKYDISARTLRYYEDMGLIDSIRSDDYAYRMYDETTVKRIEQILVLRKLDISIKDIQRIFDAQNSEIVLEVLGKKADNIDEEVALLHELKEIVLAFIHQIERADFNSDSDVKLLYEKARDIENHISDNNVEEMKNKILNILPNSQYNSGVIIPIDLGSTTLTEYNKLTYRVKSSADVYGKGVSVYISDSPDDLNDFMVGNASEFCLFNHNPLVSAGASGTEWLNGEIILNLTDSQKMLSGKIFIMIGINDMWDMDFAIPIAYQIDNICLCFTGQESKNILIDFKGYITDCIPVGIIGRGGDNPPTLTIFEENNYNRLFEISEKLKKMPEVRIVRLPKCRMATSGAPDHTFSEVWKFSDWWKDYDKKRNASYYAPMDFLFSEDGGLVWWMIVEDDATSEDCGGYEVIDFEGGLYAVHTSIDADDTSSRLVHEKINKWIANTGFLLDESKPSMGHMINPLPEIRQGLGYHQYEVFVPIKLRRPKQLSLVEKVVYTIDHNGAVFEIVGRPNVAWVGSVAYAENDTTEPDINKLLNHYREISALAPKKDLINEEWDAAISLNYTCDNGEPKGMMFAQETYSAEIQDECYQIITQPAGIYLRLYNDADAAKLLGKEKCETYELFNFMKEAIKQYGFAFNDKVPMEIEYRNRNDNSCYAYIPIIDLKHTEVNKPEIKVFQIHWDEFSFLGNENIITESSDFGFIWNNFFKKGGYDPIYPYATDDKSINVWYTNDIGQKIYLQGLFVKNVEKVPDGYKLVNFPASDFLVVTTEWMKTNAEAVGDNGNGRCNRYAKTVSIPEGYARNDGPDSPIIKIEKENSDTTEGSRYEVWVPIKKVDS